MQLPYDKELEQAVLASLLLSQDCAERVGELHADDFFLQTHKQVYRVIKELVAKGQQVDIITVGADKSVRYESLLEITKAPALPSLFDEYLGRLKKLTENRRLLMLAESIKRAVNAGREDVLDKAEAELYSIRNIQHDDDCEDLAALLGTVVDEIGHRIKHKGELEGIPTGFKDLDKFIDGLKKQNYIVIAGRSSMGKTALALSIARNVAMQGKNVAMFSLEMAKKELVKRLVLAEARISSNAIRAGALGDDDIPTITNAAAKLYNARIRIYDTPGQTVGEVRSKCRKQKIRQGLDLVVIDYLQLLRGEGSNKTEELSNISIGIKALAKDLDCPVIVLSQLNREPEKASDKRPNMAHLRGSGQIEQDADLIMLLYRDEYYNPDTPYKGVAEVIIAKQRNGPVGTVKLGFIPDLALFVDLDKIERYRG